MQRLTLCLCCLLMACVQPAPAMPEPRLAPAALGTELSLTQRLTLYPRDDAPALPVRSVETLLQVDADAVRLAGFGLGQSLLRLDWDGRFLAVERASAVPEQIDPGKILRDLQFALWPLEALRANLPPDWQLSAADGLRSLNYRGVPRLVVHAEASVPWEGRIEIDNRQEGYRLVIESAAAEETRR